MDITRERLTKKLAEFQQQRIALAKQQEQIVANMNAVTGAIQFGEILLQELEQSEPELPAETQ